MLSKAKIKYINSLQLKKHRDTEGCFVVEGEKSVLEFIRSDFKVVELYATESFLSKYALKLRGLKTGVSTSKQLSKVGLYSSNNAALAIVQIPTMGPWRSRPNEYTIALDSINDPGNLGTIIRLADWYGIKDILVSEGSVDHYNPKVVNSTKGSLSRVRVHTVDLAATLESAKGSIFAADLTGENIHTLKFPKEGVLLMGSESHGISRSLHKLPLKKMTIPSHGEAESLNVAIATAIICDNIFRGT